MPQRKRLAEMVRGAQNQGELWFVRKDQNDLDLRVVATFGVEVVRLDTRTLRGTAGTTAATKKRARGGSNGLLSSTRLGSFVFGLITC